MGFGERSTRRPKARASCSTSRSGRRRRRSGRDRAGSSRPAGIRSASRRGRTRRRADPRGLRHRGSGGRGRRETAFIEAPSVVAGECRRGRLAGGGRVRSECGSDVGVVEVVAVPKDDRGTLRRRQLVGEVLELRKRGSTIQGLELRQVGVGARAAMLVDCYPARDRVRPGAEMSP